MLVNWALYISEPMNEYQRTNRDRLIGILSGIERAVCPNGWERKGPFAVGGLTEIGFSRNSEMLLVVSSAGRGVIDCAIGKKVARDDEADGDWYSAKDLTCIGIGPIEGEVISIAGLNGGGMRNSNDHGESLELVAPDWPVYDLIYCNPYKTALLSEHQKGCQIIASGHILAHGFSWSGRSFAYATSSDVTIFARRTGDA